MLGGRPDPTPPMALALTDRVSLVCSLCRRPTKSSPVSNVGNTLLLCPHGGFMFTYDSLINGDAQQ